VREVSEPSIDYIAYEDVCIPLILEKLIYPNMNVNYYWTDDFSAKNYIALAKAGFICVTEQHQGEELLIPEIQFNYALLDFKDLHISKKVQKLLHQKKLSITLSSNLDEVYAGINLYHKNSWFSKKYLTMLKEVQALDGDVLVKAVELRENEKLIAGEIGYIIGKTYTSLSGFSSREKSYRNYGTAQLVLLAQYLEKLGCDFWNLGHPYMDYKLALGAKIYERKDFLKRWKESI
jgi:Leu/Phe-tRNA-protein transferase